MPVQTVTKTIDGHEIKIQQFYAVRGFKIKARLYKLAIPVLTSLFGTADIKSKKDFLDKNIDVAKAGETFASLVDPEQLFSLLLDLLSGSFINNQMIDEKVFNETFIANYNLAYKIAWEVIEVNHFFDFGDIGNLLKNQLNQVSPEK